MSANPRGLLNRWMKSVFGGNSENPVKKELNKRLSIEALETRENPAFNVTIGGGVLAGFGAPVITGSTVAFTANATGANLPASTIASFLNQTKFTAVTISNGATGTEAGNITWSANPLNCSTTATGLAKSLSISLDPTTAGGQINLNANMILGDQFNALTLNLTGDTAGTAPPVGTPQVLVAPIDTGLQALNITSSALSQVDRISALGSISMTGGSFTLSNQLFAGASALNPGNISIAGTNTSGPPTITIQPGDNPNGLYNFQATGTISVNGNMQSLVNSPVRFQSNKGTTYSGALGDPVALLPLGAVTLSGPGNINISGKITADALLVDPTNPNFNLSLGGGANILNQLNTNPTNLNNNGTLQVGASPSDYYLFGSGFQSNSLTTPIGLAGTVASPGAPISIGNLRLNTNAGIDTTNGNAVPAGANISLGSAKGSVIGSGSTPVVSLSLNSGNTGNITVVPVMQNIAQVVINNTNQANFTAAANLGNLVVNGLTAGNSVNFNSTATIGTLNLGSLGANSSVNFAKTSTVGAITSTNAGSYGVQFNARGTVSGPLSGNVNLIKSGSSNTTLAVAGATGTYTGSLIINAGNMAVNSSFATNPVIINGGFLVGSGAVGTVTMPGANAKGVQPGNPIGNITVDNVTFGASSQLAINLQSATASQNGRLTSVNGVALAGASLNVNLANRFFPANGSTYTIINNQSSLPTSGTFFGLPEGGTITVGGATFAITYAGGNGNDVVLTTVKTGTGNQGYVRYLYASILNRAPDDAGLAAFSAALDRGVSRQAVTTALWKSAEHRALQVQQYYTTFLNRTADAAGINFYVRAFLAGATEETVMTYFMVSSEYQVANPPVNPYITSLFNDLLNRAPSVQELNQWRGVMFAGTPRASVVQSFLFSSEYLTITVNGFYKSYLGRPAGNSGLNYWVNVAQNQRSQGLVAISILSSTEAYNSAVAG